MLTGSTCYHCRLHHGDQLLHGVSLHNTTLLCSAVFDDYIVRPLKRQYNPLEIHLYVCDPLSTTICFRITRKS